MGGKATSSGTTSPAELNQIRAQEALAKLGGFLREAVSKGTYKAFTVRVEAIDGDLQRVRTSLDTVGV